MSLKAQELHINQKHWFECPASWSAQLRKKIPSQWRLTAYSHQITLWLVPISSEKQNVRFGECWKESCKDFMSTFGAKAWRGLLATVKGYFNKCIPHQVNLYNHSGKELKLCKIKCKKIWEWRSKPKTPFFQLNIPSALLYVLASFQGLTQHDFINGIGNYRTQPIEAK